MRLVQGERSSKHISDLTYLKAPAWVVVGGLSQDPGLSFVNAVTRHGVAEHYRELGYELCFWKLLIPYELYLQD